jgi:hypothetical protein
MLLGNLGNNSRSMSETTAAHPGSIPPGSLKAQSWHRHLERHRRNPEPKLRVFADDDFLQDFSTLMSTFPCSAGEGAPEAAVEVSMR